MRDAFAGARLDAFQANYGDGAGNDHPKYVEDAARFDAWIATVRREAAAEALMAASDAVAGDEDMVINVALGGAPYVSSWLRERASVTRNETKETK